MDSLSLSKLQQQLNLKFNNEDLLFQSLVHRSYLNEDKSLKNSNERIEFLGDAILEAWISDYLYKNFPQYPEGPLTNLRALSVCTQNLALICKEIGLNDFVLLSKGEERNKGRDNPSILADSFEALVGALYLDQGFTAVSAFLDRVLIPSVIELSKLNTLKDPKSNFQEIAQDKTNTTPHYEVISESGPDHQKSYLIAAYIGEKLIAKGKGNSKQRAQEDAALKAIKILKKE